jgi:ubiquinone/menaquinone biosynthesis C-methylase UbiE
MSPKVFACFEQVATEYFGQRRPRSVLEVGAGNSTLLSITAFRQSRRVALNMLPFTNPSPELRQCELVVGNSNNLSQFNDGEFDCVMSCSVLEHDKFFWRSVAEIRRILAPGGLFVVGVPIYMTLPTDVMDTTLTFRRHGLHYDADFYRFSEQCVREVVLEDLSVCQEVVVQRYPNPYVVASGVKQAA